MFEEKKLITILTPTYNRSKELEKLYQSLKRQKVYNFDWLIVDDGSSDNTGEKVNGFLDINFRISYVF